MRMARGFTKRANFYQLGITSDGYGGNVASPDIFMFKTWIKLSSYKVGHSSQSNETGNGLDITQNAVVVTLRNRPDFKYNSTTMFFTYRGDKYIISTNPLNSDFNDAYIQFVAVRQYNQMTSSKDDLNLELNFDL